MKRVLEFLINHKYFLAILVLSSISIILNVTYSNYFVESKNHRVAEMYIGALKYSISIDSNEINTLTVEPGVTVIDVNVNNLNPVDTYYKLLYLNNSNLEIKYFSETKDTDEVKTSYKSPNDSITSSNTNNLKLFIRNNSDTNQEVSFSLKGGYINNTLSDIKVPSGYSEITIDNSSDNTYFCKTSSGVYYLSGYIIDQYIYAYKKEGKFVSSGIDWQDMSNNGWGAQLNGSKDNTDPITSKLCTYLDDKPIVSLHYMFGESEAKSIDLSSFNTSNVVDMSLMFYNTSATMLDVSNFNTSNVTDMQNMFSYSQAATLDVSRFDTSKVTNMSGMFNGSEATTLDVSNFDTSKVTDMSWMFNDSKATTLDISNFDTSKVTGMSVMFRNSSATTLDLSNFDTSNVTSMSQMFYESKATLLDLSNFDTSKVTDMGYMFSHSPATILGLSNFDTSNVTGMLEMFSYSPATTLDLSSFDTSKVTDMGAMFSSSTNLKTIYVSDKFNTDAVTNSASMFKNCTSLVGGTGTKYNSSYADKTYAKIDGGTSNPGYFTDIADVPNSFSTDSWKTIIKAVKDNNISKYKVGDTKTIDMGTYGTHILRIANTSTPSECSTAGFSQTACGFVIEFQDVITDGQTMDLISTSVRGWPNTRMRTFVNNDIYNLLPSDLKNGIIDTTVVSSHGSKDSSNFTSTDRLYLLSTAEIWEQGTSDTIDYDTARDATRQLDYYKNEGVTTTNYSKAIKMYNSTAKSVWLRSNYYGSNYDFYAVDSSGKCLYYDNASIRGVSPAFRIG